MATYTSNYGWTKPSGSDNVDISVLNDNLDDQDSTIHNAFLNMAPPFSESSTYAVDDIVLYTTGLYKCHTAVVTPGSWTGSTNWQVYKLSEGGSGGGGTSNYNDLTNKPSINGVTLSGNKTTSDLGIDKTAVGLGNVPNVSTNDQEPTFTEASTRNNIASGEKLSVIFGKIQKFFNDLKTVAFSGSYTDLTNKPSIPTKTSDITNDSNFVSDANYVHTDNNFTTSEKTKLAGIASGAEANVQANWSQTNTSADDFIKNKPNLAAVATSGSYTDLTNTPTIPAAQVNSDWNASSGVAEILNKPSSYTPSSHTHGNIQNGGTLQTTDVAIANGDKLVVTDSSNSAKIARTSVTFDGTTTTQALSKKGTFETFSKFSGSYTDLTDKPTIPTTASGISYDNTDSGLTATDVQGAVDEVVEKMGNVRMTKLWENPSPTSSFAAGNITLSSNDYDLILVISRYSKSSNNTVPAYIGKKGYINFADWSGQSMVTMYRSVSASGTTATFSGASVNGTINNDYLIPTVIYGIKTTASVKINAIALDVSTSADKCMLSDGVTSVEEALDGLIVVDYDINAVACDTAWGQGFLSSVISVNIASLSLQNKPTVLSATYEPVSNTRIASTLVETVSNAQINFYLSRLTASGSLTGVVHFYLKSNG